MSESDLATRVMQWLTDDGWDCYSEVQLYQGGNRADIVAVYRGKLVWIVECKLALSLAVLDQSTYWRGCAHWISVAVPARRRRDISSAAQEYLQWKGIGLMTVNINSTYVQYGEFGVHEQISAPLHRKNWASDVIKTLHPDMKRYTPGSQSGYSTPYRRTMDVVHEYIARHPGCTINDIMVEMKDRHHYSSKSSARSSIRVALGSYEPGIRLDTSQKEIRYFVESIGGKSS